MKTVKTILVAITLVLGVLALLDKYPDSSRSSCSDNVEATEHDNKMSKELSKFIAKESVGLFKLVAELKATNRQSEERREIVEKLNAQYGIVLNNLEDEEQLTQDIALAVSNFTKQQEIKFRLQKNEAYTQDASAKQCEAENKLKKASALLTKDLLVNEQGLYTYKSGEVIGTLNDVIKKFGVQGAKVKKLQETNEKYKKKLEDLAGTYAYLSGEVDKYNKTVEGTTTTKR